MDAAEPSTPPLDEERQWLARAAELALRGWGRVRPNPMVGCVLVRDGVVVGEGWHEEFGGPHAEVNALAAAGGLAADATAYVTLEPCNHFGKTPPCTDALLEAGVSRVVFAAADPGAEAAGGRRRLSNSGVQISGPLSDRALGRDVDPAFFHTTEHSRTYLALKMAVSRDARIAAGVGERTSLSGEEANREVHHLRSGFDAILIGAETARVDDPLLTVRHGVDPRVAPTRVVVDSTCRLSPQARLLRTVEEAPVLVLVTPEAPPDRIRALEGAGARVVVVPQDDGRVHLEQALASCWELGLTSVLCEGGGVLASALIREGLVQRLYLVEVPVSLGDQGVPAFPDAPDTPEGPGWRMVGEPRRLGADVLFTYDREV
jgi:diaminohydroxyphosphoribosylaminopyrimidine deaminase/5-amino-6-(5-phosphoribosylamino)uracil reductase